ncbi:MFS general substrate transporter [Melanomma pulvis-pyrius CBS 109.77]|uniref:MFS general substrate transporter n=1 Tax=Melanomma pulvis-pyrius CBS 109.77 TaxID=1314802 RepID=A0A6A6X2U4_9PLEO|nr:MFS general substrate transporter [Melanomma pulvis-pyrius CBS 109.77]
MPVWLTYVPRQLNIWTQNTNLQQRSLYISGGGIVWGLGCILGPIIGGAFADSPATWRWAFYMNLVLFGLFTPVYFFVLHPSAPPSTPLSHRLKSFDYFGILLNAGTYTTFVIGLTIGGTIWPWPSSRTIGTLATSIALLVLFAAQQKLCLLTTAQDRVFPAQFLTRRTFVLLYVAQSCVQTALAIPIYYIPLLFQFTRGETAVASALRLLPLVVVNIVVVFANGALLPRFKYYVPWYLASGAFNTLGGALFFGTLSRETSTAAVYGYSVFLALGTGLAQQCAYSIASVKAARHVSEAIGFINNAQIGSVVVALTLTSLIFQNVGFHDVKAALAGSGFDDGEIRATLGGARSALFEGVPEGVRERVEEGIVRAIRWSFFPVLLAGAIGLLAAAGMRWERLFDGENDADANEEKKEDVEKDSGGEVEKEIKKETS